MIRKILTDENPILKMKSEKVEEFSAVIAEIAKDLTETMQQEGGIGIAAPQCGILKRIIIVDTKKAGGQFHKQVMINPTIISRSPKKSTDQEGCLSVPDRQYMVMRNAEVFVSYYDVNGGKHSAQLTGLDAQCVQHEIDHLNGIVISAVGVLVEEVKDKA